MNTYTLINHPQAETETQTLFEPCLIEGVPTDLTYREANALCDQVRAKGKDVCIYNTTAV